MYREEKLSIVALSVLFSLRPFCTRYGDLPLRPELSGGHNPKRLRSEISTLKARQI